MFGAVGTKAEATHDQADCDRVAPSPKNPGVVYAEGEMSASDADADDEDDGFKC